MDARNYTTLPPSALAWHDRTRLILLPLILVFILSAYSAHAALPEAVRNALNKHAIAPSSVSALVVELGSGEALLAHQSKKPRNPASVMKLLTTFAALDILGPAYTWPTHYYINGTLHKGVLDGDLVIKGQGDPYLVKEQFWLQLAALREQGIETIKGDLLIDNSAFDLPAHDPGKFDKQPTRLYNAGPSATVLNFSASRFHIRPADGKIEILLDPPVHNIVINNQLKPASGACRGPEGGWSFDVSQKEGKAYVVFKGRYRTQCGAYDLSRVVLDSDAYLYGVFTHLWRSLGGEFAGKYGFARVSEDAIPIYTGLSKPLSEVIVGTNKFSNNLLARQLLLTIGYHDHGEGTTVENGLDSIQAWLKAQGLVMPSLVMENGAGLSRRIAISAENLGQLLLLAAKSVYRPEFQASFPLGGVDGTMKKRLNGLSPGGRVRLKTGYVRGVRTLGGYLRADSGKDYAVVLFIADAKVRYGNGNTIQDEFIQWVLQNG